MVLRHRECPVRNQVKGSGGSLGTVLLEFNNSRRTLLLSLAWGEERLLSLVRCRGPRIALTLMVVGAGFDKGFQGFEDKVAER